MLSSLRSGSTWPLQRGDGDVSCFLAQVHGSCPEWCSEVTLSSPSGRKMRTRVGHLPAWAQALLCLFSVTLLSIQVLSKVEHDSVKALVLLTATQADTVQQKELLCIPICLLTFIRRGNSPLGVRPELVNILLAQDTTWPRGGMSFHARNNKKAEPFFNTLMKPMDTFNCSKENLTVKYLPGWRITSHLIYV